MKTAASVEKVLDWVRDHPLPDKRIIPICIWGSKGAGKTSFVRGYAKQRDFGFRGYHPAHDNSGADIVGLAYFDEALERTAYARPMWLPGENDPIVWQKRGVIFIDEINRATNQVMQGLMEPLGEGTIEHSGWRLPAGWCFVCAANPPRDGYHVDRLDEAMMDRMLHVPIGFDPVRWAAWAGRTELAPDLVSFTARHPELVDKSDIELPAELGIEMTPRSVEYLGRLYEPGMDMGLLRTLSLGLIGKVATKALFEHLNSPDRPVTAEEVLAGGFWEQLQTHIVAGRDDLVEASQTLVLAMMASYKEDPQAARNIAAYLKALGPKYSDSFWQRVSYQAPHWQAAITVAASEMERSGLGGGRH